MIVLHPIPLYRQPWHNDIHFYTLPFSLSSRTPFLTATMDIFFRVLHETNETVSFRTVLFFMNFDSSCLFFRSLGITTVGCSLATVILHDWCQNLYIVRNVVQVSSTKSGTSNGHYIYKVKTAPLFPCRTNHAVRTACPIDILSWHIRCLKKRVVSNWHASRNAGQSCITVHCDTLIRSHSNKCTLSKKLLFPSSFIFLRFSTISQNGV